MRCFFAVACFILNISDIKRRNRWEDRMEQQNNFISHVCVCESETGHCKGKQIFISIHYRQMTRVLERKMNTRPMRTGDEYAPTK